MPRAIERRSTSGSSATLRECTRRICSRPFRSGLPTVTWRSNRPGRSSAGSRMSARLVAATTMMLSDCAEAVHLDEQLVERLLALFVAERVAAAAAAHGVELVDEDDARLVAARFLEQLAHARRADAGVHLDEVGAARRDERARRLRQPSNARAASCRCRAGRRAGCRAGCGRRSRRTAAGSFRKSTISLTSSLASSTPATSLNVTVTVSGSTVRAFSSVGTRPVTTRNSASPAKPKKSERRRHGTVTAHPRGVVTVNVELQRPVAQAGDERRIRRDVAMPGRPSRTACRLRDRRRADPIDDDIPDLPRQHPAGTVRTRRWVAPGSSGTGRRRAAGREHEQRAMPIQNSRVRGNLPPSTVFP